MLKLLLIIPLLGIIPLTLIGYTSAYGANGNTTSPEEEVVLKTNSLMKQIALGTSLITLLISVVI